MTSIRGTHGTRLYGEAGRGQPFALLFDGEAVTAFPGETIAAALLAAGKVRLRVSRSGSPRGLYCGMGLCYECLVTVDGRANQRACMTEARPGMVVATSVAPGAAP